MTWTYDEALGSTRDRVRLRIGDTDTNAQLLPDETLDAWIADTDDEVVVAIQAVQAILAKIARDTSRSAAGITTERDQVTTHYRDLLADLRRERGGRGRIFAGGTSRSVRDTIESDDDFVRPAFRMGQDDLYSTDEDTES